MISNRSEENRSESITLSSNVEKFYIRQGCFRTMSYSRFDFLTVKNLAKLIVENNNSPSKSSVELFGDSVKILYSELGIDRAEKEKSGIRDSKKVEKTEKVIQKSMVPDGEVKEIEGKHIHKYIPYSLSICIFSLYLLIQLFHHTNFIA